MGMIRVKELSRQPQTTSWSLIKCSRTDKWSFSGWWMKARIGMSWPSSGEEWGSGDSGKDKLCQHKQGKRLVNKQSFEVTNGSPETPSWSQPTNLCKKLSEQTHMCKSCQNTHTLNWTSLIILEPLITSTRRGRCKLLGWQQVEGLHSYPCLCSPHINFHNCGNLLNKTCIAQMSQTDSPAEVFGEFHSWDCNHLYPKQHVSLQEYKEVCLMALGNIGHEPLPYIHGKGAGHTVPMTFNNVIHNLKEILWTRERVSRQRIKMLMENTAHSDVPMESSSSSHHNRSGICRTSN